MAECLPHLGSESFDAIFCFADNTRSGPCEMCLAVIRCVFGADYAEGRRFGDSSSAVCCSRRPARTIRLPPEAHQKPDASKGWEEFSGDQANADFSTAAFDCSRSRARSIAPSSPRQETGHSEKGAADRTALHANESRMVRAREYRRERLNGRTDKLDRRQRKSLDRLARLPPGVLESAKSREPQR